MQVRLTVLGLLITEVAQTCGVGKDASPDEACLDLQKTERFLTD